MDRREWRKEISSIWADKHSEWVDILLSDLLKEVSILKRICSYDGCEKKATRERISTGSPICDECFQYFSNGYNHYKQIGSYKGKLFFYGMSAAMSAARESSNGLPPSSLFRFLEYTEYKLPANPSPSASVKPTEPRPEFTLIPSGFDFKVASIKNPRTVDVYHIGLVLTKDEVDAYVKNGKVDIVIKERE